MEKDEFRARASELVAAHDVALSESRRQEKARMAVSNSLLSMVKDSKKNAADLAVAEANVTYWDDRNTDESGLVPATVAALAFWEAEVIRLGGVIAGEDPPPPDPTLHVLTIEIQDPVVAFDYWKETASAVTTTREETHARVATTGSPQVGTGGSQHGGTDLYWTGPGTIVISDIPVDGVVEIHGATDSHHGGGRWRVDAGDWQFFSSYSATRVADVVLFTSDDTPVAPTGGFFSEDFTGTNGDTVNTLNALFTGSTVGVGSSLTVQSNKLRYRIGASGGQARWIADLDGEANVAAACFLTLPNPLPDFYFGTFLRASGDWVATGDANSPTHGVQLSIEVFGGFGAVVVYDDGDVVGVDSVSFTPVAGHVYGFLPRVSGSTASARLWDVTAGQTSATGVIASGTVTYLTAGEMQTRLGASAAIDILEDDLDVSDGTVSGGGGGPLTGVFSVVGNTIYDPAGDPFIPIGCNLLGERGWWERDSRGLAPTLGDWGFNLVRLNCNAYNYVGEGNWPAHYSGGFSDPADYTDAIIDEYEAAGIVTMISAHNFTCGFPGGQLDVFTAWWVDKANRYKDRPYVWFNIGNEMGYGSPAPEEWFTVHDHVISAIRAAGADNICVADGNACAQDRMAWDNSFVVTDNSAILHHGPRLLYQGNVAFSFHVYDQWNASTDDKMEDYLRRVHAADMAIMSGELGWQGYVDTGDGHPWKTYHEAFDMAMRVCPAEGVGVIAWHGQGFGNLLDPGGDGFNMVPGFQDLSHINSTTAPTNLTHQGQAFWDLAHA